MNTWANQLDIILVAYRLHVNIISVGNYVNRFICNNMYLYLNHILKCNDYLITERGTKYVCYFICLDPLHRITDGNHFACMRPIHSINDQFVNHRQDGKLRTGTFLNKNPHRDDGPCITNQHVISNQDGQLYAVTSLSGNSQSKRSVELCINKIRVTDKMRI